MSQIVIVSGPPGAGKSSVCEALCERYDRTVHLETDDAYGWIRMGYTPPWREGSADQNMIVSRACARAAVPFAQKQYGVFIDGVIGPAHFPMYIEELSAARVPVHYVVLLPPVDEITRRATAPEKTIAGAPSDMYARVHSMFDPKASPGSVIDNKAMSSLEAADAVMDACGRGDALVWTP